jgi:vitamin B12 transporter
LLVLLFSACALCASLALAPTPSPSPSTAPPPEIAHVYTSDRTDETLKNAARTTYVVSHDQIARYGYRTVAEALSNVPGMQILPYGPLGSNANYGLRGSSSAQVLVLVDGAPAPGSFSNSVELGNLPVTGVDRIEIVEGGGSTLYGSGAIGGIINIITQRQAESGATLRYGSFSDRELYVTSPHVQISRVLARNDFALPGAGAQPDNDYEASSIHVNDSRRIGSFEASLRAGLTSDHIGTPGLVPFQSPTSRESDLNGDANLMLTRKSAQAESTLQFGGTRQRIGFACDESTDSGCFQSVESLNQESRVAFSARSDVEGANEQLLYGLDVSRGTVRSDAGGTFSTDAMAQAAAYMQQHRSTAWGGFYYGVRAERDGAFGGEFSPSAGFIARLSDAFAVKGNIATAFRAPNATELFFPGYGYTGLHPERAKVMDVTLTDSRALGGVSLGWFQNRTNDLIVPVLLDPATFTYGPRNVDHAFIQGLTLDARTQPFNGFTAALNATDLYRAQDLDAQTRLPNDAVLTANLRLDYTGRATGTLDGFGIVLHAQGARGYVDATQPLFDQPAAFTTLNAYVSVRAGRNALLTLRGYNLGNERYAALGGFGGSVNGYPMPGRSFVVELSGK